MRTIILVISLLITAVSAPARHWEAVKGSSEYIYGEGWAPTVAEADRLAINDLISKISLHVASSTSQDDIEITDNDSILSRTSFQSAVSTYSQATLNNTEKIILENEPDAHVGRWIRRDEVNKIFEGRKAKVIDYVTSAEKAETQGKIDIALKDFYWALALLKSLQHPNELRYETEDGDEVMLSTWIPRRLNDILGKISAQVASRTGDDVEVRIHYDGKPLTSIDYSYFDGRDWSNIYSAKDGVGTLELAPGNQSSHYQLRFEYEYRSEAHIDREVESVLQAMSGTPVRAAYQTIKAVPQSAPTARTSVAKASAGTTQLKNSFSQTAPSVFRMPEPYPDHDGRYEKTVSQVVEAVKSRNYDAAAGCFTPAALDTYHRLVKYGTGRVMGTPELTFYRMGDGVMARGVQMSFTFRNGLRKSFIEDITFYMDSDAKIENLVFGLDKTAEADILGKGVWDETARFAIMNFLENYQTAYALKRLDYIERIFDDDAVIIVGSVVKSPATSRRGDSNIIQVGGDIIRYNRHTKDSYLRDLKRSFASKEFINLRFADNEVRKLGKGGELYAIQISQEYYSSNYGDKGYLFLMVDINDPENPIIKVRTWQPEKDPDFGLYGPEHFK